MLDPAPVAPLSAELLRRVDWLTPNETEAAGLLGRPGSIDDPLGAAEALRGLGARNVALKLGRRGAFILAEDGTQALVAPPAVIPVDTTAAGDAFNGAFAIALAEAAAPLDAARFACAAAAWSVTRFGAQPAMPTRAEAMGLLQTA